MKTSFTLSFACWVLPIWLLLLLPASVSAQGAQFVPFYPGPCTFDPGVTTLGDPNAVTTISGGQVFDGIYHVVGSLHLEAGLYEVKPGTVFYIESKLRSLGPDVPALVRGAYIELGYNARLIAQEATFRAACDAMWYGIILQAEQPGQILDLQDCTLAQARQAVYIPESSYSSQYTIQHCSFYHNLYDIYDDGRHEGTQV